VGVLAIAVLVATAWLVHKIIANHMKPSPSESNFQSIKDNFSSLAELKHTLQKDGFRKAKLIVAIDFSKSNEYTGKDSFDARSLHEISPALVGQNPYQQVLSLISQTMAPFVDTKSVAMYGFGDATTTDKAAFSMLEDDNSYCKLDDILPVYNDVIPRLALGGPTSFEWVIRKAIDKVKKTSPKRYHVLIILTDGQVVDEHETSEAIVDASAYPLSIICFGVGDGPWNIMNEFDDALPKRLFDNLQFVSFSQLLEDCNEHGKNLEQEFPLQALMEIPEQFSNIKALASEEM